MTRPDSPFRFTQLNSKPLSRRGCCDGIVVEKSGVCYRVLGSLAVVGASMGRSAFQWILFGELNQTSVRLCPTEWLRRRSIHHPNLTRDQVHQIIDTCTTQRRATAIQPPRARLLGLPGLCASTCLRNAGLLTELRLAQWRGKPTRQARVRRRLEVRARFPAACASVGIFERCGITDGWLRTPEQHSIEFAGWSGSSGCIEAGRTGWPVAWLLNRNVITAEFAAKTAADR